MVFCILQIGPANERAAATLYSLYGKYAHRWSTIVSISRVSPTFGAGSIGAVD